MTQYQFIELIKEKRVNLLLTQKELAKMIPLSKSTYCKIENHKQALNYDLIKRLSEIFNIDLNIIKSEKPNYIYFD